MFNIFNKKLETPAVSSVKSYPEIEKLFNNRYTVQPKLPEGCPPTKEQFLKDSDLSIVELGPEGKHDSLVKILKEHHSGSCSCSEWRSLKGKACYCITTTGYTALIGNPFLNYDIDVIDKAFLHYAWEPETDNYMFNATMYNLIGTELQKVDKEAYASIKSKNIELIIKHVHIKSYPATYEGVMSMFMEISGISSKCAENRRLVREKNILVNSKKEDFYKIEKQTEDYVKYMLGEDATYDITKAYKEVSVFSAYPEFDVDGSYDEQYNEPSQGYYVNGRYLTDDFTIEKYVEISQDKIDNLLCHDNIELIGDLNYRNHVGGLIYTDIVLRRYNNPTSEYSPKWFASLDDAIEAYKLFN